MKLFLLEERIRRSRVASVWKYQSLASASAQFRTASLNSIGPDLWQYYFSFQWFLRVTELWSLYRFLQQSKSYRAAAAHTMQISVIKTFDRGHVQGLRFISLNPKGIGWAKTKEFCLVKGSLTFDPHRVLNCERIGCLQFGFSLPVTYTLVSFLVFITSCFVFRNTRWFGERPEVSVTGYAYVTTWTERSFSW
jgi:hypothetical protein